MFETYITKMVEQHVLLEGLTKYGYKGIDEGTKVCLLLEGIMAPELEVTKTCILSDAGLHMDFKGCTILFKDFLKQNVLPNACLLAPLPKLTPTRSGSLMIPLWMSLLMIVITGQRSI